MMRGDALIQSDPWKEIEGSLALASNNRDSAGGSADDGPSVKEETSWLTPYGKAVPVITLHLHPFPQFAFPRFRPQYYSFSSNYGLSPDKPALANIKRRSAAH